MKLENLRTEVAKVVRASVAPKITTYKNEMVSVRDKMFSGILTSAPAWTVTAVALHSPVGSIAALIGALTKPGSRPPRTTTRGSAKAGRDHAVSYLLRLVEETGGLAAK